MTLHSGIRAPLARVRGLGSAHNGTHHWVVQRVTAIALIPLTIWFVYSVMSLTVTGSQTLVTAWLQSPWHALALAALVVALFTHARLGLQVVIEDYVACRCKKVASLLLIHFAANVFILMSLLAIAKLHLTPLSPF